MTILKPGKTNNDVLYKAKCRYDGCLFVFSGSEARYSYLEGGYSLLCPTCGVLVAGKTMNSWQKFWFKVFNFDPDEGVTP